MSRQLGNVSKRSEIAGAVIDSLAFAHEGGRLAGRVPLVELPRLADVLVDTEGAIDCELAGEQGRGDKAYLLLRLAGCLKLRCQRCLETVEVALQVSSRFLLVPPGQSWPDDELAEDGFDAIAAEMEMALLPLIEDEVLLALPIAPRHQTCKLPAAYIECNGPSPFAVLGQLKKGV
jgi:uncharacterized protein